MKILAQAVPNNTTAGFQRAAEAAGHTWIWWEERHTAAFDVFDEIKPDIMFLMEPSRAITKCIKERPIVVVRGLYNEPFTFMVNNQSFPCGRLVDKHIFCLGDTSPAYLCDIGITCQPHPIGIKLCRDIGAANIKIICNTAWGVVQYLGAGSLENKKDLYRSSSIVLVDSLLEAMRVAACGSVPINVGKRFVDQEFYERCLEADDVEEVWQHYNNKTCQHVSRTNLASCIAGHTYDDALGVILTAMPQSQETP